MECPHSGLSVGSSRQRLKSGFRKLSLHKCLYQSSDAARLACRRNEPGYGPGLPFIALQSRGLSRIGGQSLIDNIAHRGPQHDGHRNGHPC